MKERKLNIYFDCTDSVIGRQQAKLMAKLEQESEIG